MSQVFSSTLPEKGMGVLLWRFYRIFLVFFFPIGWLWIQGRILRGKENRARLGERFGFSSVKEPPVGHLVWIHGASVGEVMGVLGLVEVLLAHREKPSILITTGTVASARIIQKRFSHEPRVIHQMVPFDWPWCVNRFLDFWHPRVALLAEGDLWPHLIRLPAKKGIPLFLISAQLSRRSFKRWSFIKPFLRFCTQEIRGCLTVSEAQSKRFSALEVPRVSSLGSLKWSAPLLPVDTSLLEMYQGAFKERLLWIAVSTHRGEEKLILHTYHLLRKEFPHLLLVLVPRHMNRVASVEALCQKKGLSVIRKKTFDAGGMALRDVFLVDEMGSLGLFYRLPSVVLLGGSLKPGIGGHNPIEPAAFGRPILWGPFMEKQTAIINLFKKESAARFLEMPEDLYETMKDLLENSEKSQQLGLKAQLLVEGQRDRVLNSYLKLIVPFLRVKEFF